MNCIKVFRHLRLVAVFHTVDEAEMYINMCCQTLYTASYADYSTTPTFIEGIGF